MSLFNREEPSFIQKIPHALMGTGHYGEYLTDYALDHGELGKVETFTNVLVPRKDAAVEASEIDVLMLHETGLYVCESKNYSGWIFGSADQRSWTCSLNAHTKERFYNPIMQNRAHVKALAAHLELPLEVFRSYIVFSIRCELKKVPEDTAEYCVCKRPDLLERIRKDIAERPVVFDDEAFERVRQRLEELADASNRAARKEHVEDVKRFTEGDECPLCGSKLVKREGRYGAFIGCSGYPKCRFTRDL